MSKEANGEKCGEKCKNYRILDTINGPEDLKSLSLSEMKRLASEIRRYILENVSRTGGHLASNLGVVELTCAIHYCFNAPADKIVWDVGHQSYVHKILTGRRKQFGSLRQKGGLSGFAKMSESEYDSFGAGHASTSISAALGLAVARDLKGEDNKVLAVIGDGSITGGLAFEGLNNAGFDGGRGVISNGKLPTDLIVIVNDNEMSISRNVGALSKHLNNLRTAPFYIGAKEEVRWALGKLTVGRPISEAIVKLKDKLKYLLISGVLFEEMGFKYYGPIDGHDLEALIKVFSKIKTLKEPVVLHIYTKKGKGYKYAEENPKKFHGASEFNTNTGAEKTKIDGFTEVFGSELAQLGEENKRIVAITAAMKDGCGLNSFARKFPERFFDVGIAEAHGAVFGAGLAAGGFIPVYAVYSTFLQRAYDNVIHDICLQNLPMVLAVDRAGVLPGDGPTHQGIFDISFLNHIPNMNIMAPRDETELREMLRFAVELKKPVAIRYPKESAFELDVPAEKIAYGKAQIIKNGSYISLIAVGTMVGTALKVCEKLEADGYRPYVVNARFVKPFDKEVVGELAEKCAHIFTIEDGVVAGGFGERISEYVKEFEDCKVTVFGHGDVFPQQGTRRELLSEAGLDAEGIYEKIMARLRLG